MIDRLAEDYSFVNNAGELIEAPMSDPAYTRFESSLFLGFDDAPKVEVPTKAPSRSCSCAFTKATTKNARSRRSRCSIAGGEIAIFRRTVGLNIVFFGQALIGSKHAQPDLHAELRE
jgi:hypothetical protein